MLKLIVFIGIFLFPIFTLGCVLCHYDHKVLGCIAILYSIFNDDNTNKKKNDIID